MEWMTGVPGAMQTNVGSNKISLIFINTVHTFHIHSCEEFPLYWYIMHELRNWVRKESLFNAKYLAQGERIWMN